MSTQKLPSRKFYSRKGPQENTSQKTGHASKKELPFLYKIHDGLEKT